jgi:hypothetical protein
MNAITSIAGKVQSSFGINARKRYRKAFAGRSERPFAWVRCLSKATRVFGRRIQMVTKAGPSNEASPESALGSLTHTETRKAHVMKGTRTSNFVAAVIVGIGVWVLPIPPAWGQNNPVPQIDLPLVPASAQPGGPAFTLTVNGTGFVSGSGVRWNGGALTTTFVSSKQLTALISATDIATAGTASVTVKNPPPGGGSSNVAFFEVTIPASTVSLSTATSSTGNSPTSVVVADFTRGRAQDLAVTNEVDNTVSILLGNGNGTFQPHIDYPTGLGPEDVAVGDFNHDGVLDLAVVNAGENTLGQPANSVSILLGNGDGTFQPHVDYPTGQLPFHVAVGDFNGDGNLDLAVVDQYDDAVSILLGNGDGTLQPEIEYGVSTEPTSVVVSDFNRDGILDLAVANFAAGTVSILLGNGNGTFQPASDYSATENPGSLAAADFNGDGIPDLAVAEFGSAAVSILLGNGDGTFQNQVRYTTGTYPEGVTIGDFNGDGILDLALPNDNDLGSVSVLLGNGNGTFQNALTFPAGLLPVSIAAADFNNDGRLDAASADVNNNSASVQLSTTLVFTPASVNFGSVNIGVTSSPQTVTLTNIGTSPLSLSSIATAAPYNQTNTCGDSLGAGATCNVTVTFTPTGAGTASGALTITDSAVGSPQTVMLSGSGNGPVASFSPTSLNFGDQIVNSRSTPQTVTLTNTGNATLNITSITATGDYSITGNTCGSTLAASANCIFNIAFTPTTTGTRTGNANVADNGYESPQAVPLTGVGIQGIATLSPSSLVFAVQLINTTSPAQTVTLTNTGTATLTINSVDSPTNFLETNTCTTILVGGTCTFTVTFDPANPGNPAGAINIFDNGANSPQSISVSGTATEVSVNPNSLNFGSVNLGSASLPLVVTLINVSTTQTLGSLRESISGNNPSDFTYTGNCGTSVPPLGTCIVNVTFTPGGTGSRSAVLNFNDNGGASPQTVTLSGTGNPTGKGPIASFNPTSLDFPNQGYNTKSQPLVVTLTNTGSSTMTVSGATISGSYTQTNNCPGTLSAGSNCTFSVTFKPSAVGANNGALTVTDNAPGSPQSIPLTGVGTGGVAGLSPSSLTYGVQLVGTTSPAQAVTLSNTGNAALTINSITAPDNFGQSNDCGTSLAPNSSCTISVTFVPTTSGSLGGNVTVSDNSAGSNSQRVTVSGTATVVNLVPASLSFGSVYLGQTSSPQMVILTNVGLTSLGITSIKFTGANPTDFAQSNTCGSSVPPQGSCTFSVTFAPAATGALSASLSVYDAGGASPQSVTVSGSGVPTGSGPAVSFNPTSVSFGDQDYNTKSGTSAVAITNTGGATLDISSVTATSNFIETNNCPATLASGSNCTVSINFKPAQVGNITGTLSVTDNAQGSPQGVPLTGVGMGAGASLSPSSLTFSTQVVDTSSPSQPVTLTNTGNATLTITSISSPANYSQTNNCGSSLGAGASCTINVTFSPTGNGTLGGSITVSDNAAGSPSQKISVTGVGTNLSVSPTGLSFGTVEIGQSSAPQNVTLTDVSTTSSVTISSIGISGNNPGDFSQSNTCGNHVAPGASCTIAVTFTPQATGSRSASVSIVDSAGGSPQSVALSGTGD